MSTDTEGALEQLLNGGVDIEVGILPLDFVDTMLLLISIGCSPEDLAYVVEERDRLVASNLLGPDWGTELYDPLGPDWSDDDDD